MDHRMAARRRQVAEVHARSRFSRLVWVLALLATSALTVWLLRSPVLAIQRITIEGIEPEQVAATLTEFGVVEGAAMIAVDASELATALETDPRIKQATVEVRWPQEVSITVSQRHPVAWATVAGQWALVAADGVALSTASEPSRGWPRLELSWEADPGAEALGGLAFLSELDPLVGARTTVIAVGGEMWALIEGVRVRLGRPVAMTEKARALEAVLAQGVPADATVNLIAPSRPAVTTPAAANSQVQVEP
jgi:cell division septal protein FtsQ